MSDSIGARLRQVRADMKVGEFADRLGVNRKTVTRWEADDTIPDGQSLLLLLELFGVDPRWLLTGQGSPPGLTPEELALLDNYRHCPPEGRAAMRATSAALSEQPTRKKVKRG